MELRKRIGRAVLVGMLWVNLPVACLLTMPVVLISLINALARQTHLQTDPAIAIALGVVCVIAIFVVPFVLAWLWWSINVPRWRVWALDRVRDWPELERAAIGAGIIWDNRRYPGTLLEKTEIWRTSDRERFAQLRRLGPQA